MNANELADELEGAVLKLLANDCFLQAQAVEKVETMLRQQQAEIEALKKLVSEMKYEKSSGVYEMNNEPVNPYQSITDTKIEPTIVSYTHPVKELHLSLQKSKQTGELLAVTYTDDEHRIVEVLWQRPPVKELTDEEIKHLASNCFVDFKGQHVIEFARAIEAKVRGEK